MLLHKLSTVQSSAKLFLALYSLVFTIMQSEMEIDFVIVLQQICANFFE